MRPLATLLVPIALVLGVVLPTALSCRPEVVVELPPDGGVEGCGSACPDQHACVSNLCLLLQCEGRWCAAHEVCLEDRCLDRACVGVACPAGTLCAAGSCLRTHCLGVACPAEHVCVDGECLDRRCAGVACPEGRVCANGSCYPQSCQAESCDPAQVCIGERCTDRTCAGITCSGGRACEAGTCSTCAPDHREQDGVCVPRSPLGESCDEDQSCQSGHCADERCCQSACTAPCQRCDGAVAGSCGPASAGWADARCGTYACDGEGACKTLCQVPADCQPWATCSGGGECEARRPPGESCLMGAQCASGHCVDAVCCEAACASSCEACDLPGKEGSCLPAPAGTTGAPPCPGQVCDGTSGQCPTSCADSTGCQSTHWCSGAACAPRLAQGQLCLAAEQCQSSQCVDGRCCDAACQGPCQACDLAGSAGTCTHLPAGGTGSPSCTPYACGGAQPSCPTTCASNSGCASGYHCNGGTCVPKGAQGETCATGTGCQSGQCVDGYCCDSACASACEACDRPGNLGSCGPVAAGTSDSFCAPYLCAGSSGCPSSCTASPQCAPGAFCSGGICQGLLSNGASCTLGSQCQSGQCVDGYCCNQACTGSCDACNLSGNLGTCTQRPAGSAGSPSCSPYVCSGASASCPSGCTGDSQCASGHYCNGTSCVQKRANGLTCTGATMCASGNCVDGYCCNSACAGSCNACNLSGTLGTCTLRPAGSAGSPTCSPYLCSGSSASCPTSCASAAACASGMYCVSGVCQSSGVKPVAGTASISGSPIRVGTLLTAVPSGFSLGTPTGSYHYLWRRCTTSACTTSTPIGGNLATYTPVAADAGSYLRVGIYASNSCAIGCGPSATVYSAATAAVQGTQLSRTLTINKDMLVARNTSTGANYGAGADPHLTCGYVSWLPGHARSFLQFNLNWTGVSRIVRAQLRVRTNGYHGSIGTSAAVHLDRVTGTWAEGSYGANEVWHSGEVALYPGPAVTTTGRVSTSGQTANGTWYLIDITPMLNAWAPAGVQRSDGTPGGAAANYGIRCISQNEASATTRTGFDSKQSVNPPSIILTYY